VTHPSLAVESPKVRWIIFGLSLGVLLAVMIAIGLGPAPTSSPVQPSLLARVNVALNASAGLFLLAGFAFVRAGNVAAHKRCMLTAFSLSSAFLVSYLLHHAQVGSVPFRGTGVLRSIYFGILVPHILLAGGIVPLALFTVYRGWTNRIAAHRTIAKYTLPLWLFVSASGVVVYVMLYYLP
jgi:uncharacterized membrane protein YozB (DUF420 family)